MVSYGGFYISPTEWRKWVRAQNPPYERWGAANAEYMIGDKLRESDIRARFGIDMVPVPKSEPKERGYAIMIYRRKDKQRRVYLPPRDTSEKDQTAKRLLEQSLELELCEWRTIWFDEYSIEPDAGAVFLTVADG
ncbi:hypothetical protein FS749_004407 [Ceratobasidium sp. UAMH 11750]|nr:hypothetical protein FS749_004407 [Ceratobasidium sp. UAMH 11750]